MPFNPRDDQQPTGNPTADTHRRYIPAVWKPQGEGGGAPKIEGGYEIDQKGRRINGRGLNRPGQRYQQAPDTVAAMRQTRAVTESSSTTCLLGVGGEIEVRGTSGNCYDVNLANGTCDCPDFLKLKQSYDFRRIFCKHIRIVIIQQNAAGATGLRLSVQYVANQLNIDIRTVQQMCQDGELSAIKENGVWCIDPGLAPAVITAYAERIPFYGGPADQA